MLVPCGVAVGILVTSLPPVIGPVSGCLCLSDVSMCFLVHNQAGYQISVIPPSALTKAMFTSPGVFAFFYFPLQFVISHIDIDISQ